jgi:O-antigen/teichoic acid export membrane protein
MLPYSILSNLVIGALLLRLWILDAAPALIIGLYLILTSAARFVEESYRAEPQTKVFAGLHLYQWLALLGFAGGILFTMATPAPPPAPLSPINPWLIATSLLVGIAGWFVTGVDFPQSNRRFSRLAPADEPPRLLRP